MTISEKPSESIINDELNKLVDKLEKDKNESGIKLMNDGMFDIDISSEIDSTFEIETPPVKEEDGEIIYV